MRRWFAILGLLLLAACQAQTPATTKAPQSSQSSQSGGDQLPQNWDELSAKEQPKPKYFGAEAEKTKDRMMVALVGDCYKRLQDKVDFDRCLRKDLAVKFDASGQGEDKCAGQSDLDAYATCMIVGNASIDFARRLDSEVKIDDDIWDSPRAFSDFLDKVAVSNAVVACRDATTELAGTRCVFDWMLSRVNLPEEMAKKCSPDLVAQERTICIGEAATIRFIQERLGQAAGSNI